MHYGNVFHLYCKNPVDSRNETIRISFQVIKIFWKGSNKNLLLSIIHCFDKESSIKWWEHEATTLSCRFFCFEKLFRVGISRERFFNHLRSYSVHLFDSMEHCWCPFSDFDLLIYCHSVMLLLLWSVAKVGLHWLLCSLNNILPLGYEFVNQIIIFRSSFLAL